MKCPHKGIFGICFHCKYHPTWDEEKQKMTCVVYPDGIPANQLEQNADGTFTYCTQSMDEATEARMRELNQKLKDDETKQKKITCQGLVGYCFHCSNFARWDEEKQKMVCMAYHEGIPDSMWERVEEGKNCLYWKKDRLSTQIAEIDKQLAKMRTMIIPDEDYDLVHDKLNLIYDEKNISDKTVRMRGKEFEKWLEKNYKKK